MENKNLQGLFNLCAEVEKCSYFDTVFRKSPDTFNTVHKHKVTISGT